MAQRIPLYDDLLAAMTASGCPMCRVLAESSDRYIKTVLYEAITDVGLRTELLESRGYCARHTALLDRTGGAQGTAAIMLSILKTVDRATAAADVTEAAGSRLRTLTRALESARGEAAGQKLADDLAPNVPCPLCTNEAEMTALYARTFVDHLEPDSDLATAYAASDGLCLPHFQTVASHAPTGPVLTTLVATQREIWQHLMEELEEFLRKSDHRFRHETIGPERDAWQRAMAAVAGASANIQDK